MLRALIEGMGPDAADPGSLLTHLNREFTGILREAGMVVFASAFYCVASVGEPELRVACAGHPWPLQARRASGEVTPLTSENASAGPALGLLESARFTTHQSRLEPDDFLLLFTDGIIEVESKTGAQFGIDGLCRTIRRNLAQTTETVLEAIVREIGAFSGSEAFADDVCLVAAELPRT
jgi:sigma-B regulation protein RsbU (phosphoserine phosphatase)